MNTLVSYDWLKEYVKLKETPEEFARRVSLSGPAVEKILKLNTELDEKIVIGKILELNKHPNADKLKLVSVDVGQPQPLSIVCGGSNLELGQYVAVALIGAKVRWHGEGEPIVLEPAEIRGVKSEGMICASTEIGLGEAFPNSDRMILDLGFELGWNDAAAKVKIPKLGTPLADVLGGSDDVGMDIEVTSNRVDCMGMVGMAREAAAILDREFIWKEPKKPKYEVRGTRYAVPVKISAKKECPRYMAAKITGVKVGPSPWWLKRRLLSAGLRPINNIVDISNYVMLELAQPTHIFDAATLDGGIDIRLSRMGEKIQALDGKTYELDDTILLIADQSKPIAIAGVMGGEQTGVTLNTTDVIIEAAAFDPVCIRRGARKINLQSDAQLRFEKGLSTEAPPIAMARTIELVLELAGGKLEGDAADVGQTKYKPLSFSTTVDEVDSLIGVKVPKTEMVDRLRRLGFKVKVTGKTIKAEVPWWRDHDIELGRDLVEEIARIEGYANIPGIIPFGLRPRPMDAELIWEKRSRDILKGAGLSEVYSYSFVSQDLLAKADYDAKGMLHVQNPLTAEYEVMRTSLLPSLLQAAAENSERFPEQRLFEVANVYYPASRGTDSFWSDLPDEQLEIGMLFLGMPEPWRAAKGVVEHLLDEMGIQDISWKRLDNDSFWHPGHSVQAFVKEKLVATVGELSPKVAKNFKFESPIGLVDIPFEDIVGLAAEIRAYRPVTSFPEAKRDLSVVVDFRVEYDDIAREILSINPLVTDVAWFDTYRGENLPADKKSVAMHVTFSSPERTLESAEVDALMEKITLDLKEKFKAEMRG
ncbi:MAG: phenylalanine--tRNA ligase subunit beta [Patescibacteria group bacterium]|nr:phenylalanine--tRNA ligase subunit beta [Patescibacteria group bacterium]